MDFLHSVISNKLNFEDSFLIGDEFLVFLVKGFEAFAGRIPLIDSFFVLDIVEAFGGIVGTGGEGH